MIGPDPLSQACLRLWIGLYPGSLLTPYLRPLTLPPAPVLSSPPKPYKPRHRPRSPRVPGISKAQRQERVDRREDAARASLVNTPLAEWALRLIGDGRIDQITLPDIIVGTEHYFEVFDQIRKQDIDTYRYFSRIGIPLIFENTRVWESALEMPRVANPELLPSRFAAFFTRSEERSRDAVINDKSELPEFIQFIRLKTHRTAAPLGTAVYECDSVYLKRDRLFTKEEQKRFPMVRRNWGFGCWIGVLPDGTIKALPCQMSHHQKLPRGGMVHHSSFEIPRGLYDLGDGNPHNWVRRWFALVAAFTGAATAGLLVTIKKDRHAARFGIPVMQAKHFFSDRDSSGRRRPILHLMQPHHRTLANGRVITVGEHLRGDREFSWRGYRITVGAPGIHFPIPEAATGDLYDQETLVSEEMPKDAVLSTAKVGEVMAKMIWSPARPKFKRGAPSWSFRRDNLPVKLPPSEEAKAAE